MSSSLFPIALCLLSAVTVAATNLFVKRGGDVLSTRMIVSIAMALSALPFVAFVPLPTPAVWGALAISVVVHWFYQFAMIRALHRGDLSLVFPVMRGLAPLLTAITATVALNETPGLLGWLGLVIATGALIVFATPEEKGGKTSADQTGGSVLGDGDCTRDRVLFGCGCQWHAYRADASTVFTLSWLFLLDWIGITTAMFWVRKGKVWADIAPQIRDGVIGGLLGSVSYGAALWAFTMTEAANVTAIRETSVVFGAIFGAVFLKEAFGPRRILAAGGLAFGLMLLEFAP